MPPARKELPAGAVQRKWDGGLRARKRWREEFVLVVARARLRFLGLVALIIAGSRNDIAPPDPCYWAVRVLTEINEERSQHLNTLVAVSATRIERSAWILDGVKYAGRGQSRGRFNVRPRFFRTGFGP